LFFIFLSTPFGIAFRRLPSYQFRKADNCDQFDIQWSYKQPQR